MDVYGPFYRGDKTRCVGKLFGGASTLRQNSNLKSTVRLGRDSGAICNMNGGTGCVVGSFGAARWKIRLLPFRGVPVFAVR